MSKKLNKMLGKALKKAGRIEINMYDGHIAGLSITKEDDVQPLKERFVNLQAVLLEQGTSCGLKFQKDSVIFTLGDGAEQAMAFPLNVEGTNQFAEYLSERFFNAASNKKDALKNIEEHSERCTKHERGHNCNDCHDCSCQYSPDTIILLWKELTPYQRMNLLKKLNNKERAEFLNYLATKGWYAEIIGLPSSGFTASEDKNNHAESDESSNVSDPLNDADSFNRADGQKEPEA